MFEGILHRQTVMIRYQLNKVQNTEDFSLQLSFRNRIVREWSGEFARLIWKKTIRKFLLFDTKVELDKKQMHQFYVDLTCLYQQSIVEHSIDKDLIQHNVSSKLFSFAQSLLLKIRINKCHQSYDDMLSYYFGEFNHTNKVLFDQTLDFLINKKLIQSIHVVDDIRFFDKNINLHDHLYFKKQGKLVDCNSQLKKLLKSINCQPIINQDYSKLYILNSHLN